MLTFWVKDPEAQEEIYRGVQAFEHGRDAQLLQGQLSARAVHRFGRDQKFPPVKCPVLMFHGLKDTALLPGALNDTWKWVDKDLTLITIPGAEPFRAARRGRQSDQSAWSVWLTTQ